MKYGILETHKIHIPGDERSITHPGHGYPAHIETYQRLHEFDYERELQAFLKMHESSLSSFRLIQFEDLDVKRNVVFSFDPK